MNNDAREELYEMIEDIGTSHADNREWNRIEGK